MTVAKRRKARSGVDTAARQRGIRALELRTRGYSLDQIAEELGYASRSGPAQAIDRELNRWSEEAAATHRRVMARQLDGLIRDQYDQMDRCDKPMDRVWFVDRLRGLLQDKSKLLGLALTPDERNAMTPWVKRIILEEPGQPLLEAGEIVEEDAE